MRSKNAVPSRFGRASLVLAASAALLAACALPETAPSSRGSGVIAGRVVDLDGRPVPAATVTVGARQTAVSDARGGFSLPGVLPGEAVPVTVTSDEFVTTTALVAVEPGLASARTIPLIRRAPAQRLSAAEGGSVALAGGEGSVSVEGGSLVDAAGRPAQGDVFVRATYIDPRDPRQIRAAPASFQAQDSLQRISLLETRGMVEVYATDANGRALQLARGRTASITWPRAGELGGNLYVVSPRGYWREVASMRATTQITTLANWNWDYLNSFTCIRVKVNPAAAGVRVIATGVTYPGWSDAYTNAAGLADIGVKPSSTVDVSTSSVAGAVRVQTPAGPVVPAAPPQSFSKACPPTPPLVATLNNVANPAVGTIDGVMYQ